MRIGFLFNHEQTHQIAHSLPVAVALSRLAPDLPVTLLSGSATQTAEIRRLAARLPEHRCALVELAAAERPAWPLRLLGRLAPVDRFANLRANLELFAGFDVLVVPEKTSLFLKTRFGLSHLKFVHTRHGAGDRAVGFDSASGRFDLVLMSGPKIRDRLRAAGQLDHTRWAIVGYPKFDTVDLAAKPDLFGNGRPTVLYNPHPSPHLSSWYRMGREILEFFYRSQDYNLIFAPHVMLFERSLSISLDPLSIARPGRIPARYRDCSHMLIDTGSPASTDMTYTLAADIYLGDASSQIYEFLVRPRPCLFANPNRLTWQGDANFAHWQAGPVFETLDRLAPLLGQAEADFAAFRPVQERLFSYSFDLTAEPSGQRAAQALLDWLADTGTWTGAATGGGDRRVV
jgi:hypothetical protein